MAFTVTETGRGPTWTVHEVTATDNADVDTTVPHGLGVVPSVVMTWI